MLALVMPHAFAHTVEILTTVMAVAGMGYFLASILAAHIYLHLRRKPAPVFAPGVTVMKSLKGVDPGMMDAFRSHCRQEYAGDFELLFGVASLDDPAVAAVERLQTEFPSRTIKLIECPERLGTNGKVSTLFQMSFHARHDFLLINDADISVSPHYLARVMSCFAPSPQDERKPLPPVGLATALYRGQAHGTLGSRFESLGIATDFMPGVLLSRLIEGGLHYGLGSTLAVRREALEKAGGLLALVDHLADDYEMGARVANAGYRVALCSEVVATGIPAYRWREFVDHQLRWARTVRDSRPGGYFGLIVTYGFAWATLNLLASGLSPLSLWIFALSFFLRLAQAMTVGAQVLGDHQVLGCLWLLPLRDFVQLAVWIAGLAGNTIVWRGERFLLKDGRLHREPAG
jgi:ceramide glucosyltransferase